MEYTQLRAFVAWFHEYALTAVSLAVLSFKLAETMTLLDSSILKVRFDVYALS